MPLDRPTRRAATSSKPKYTFSDDEDDYDEESPSEVYPSYNPLPTPSPSATPPARSSHTRKRSPTHIPRPRNAFIIFRSEFCERQKMSENGIESDHRHISRIAAHVWNNLDEDKTVVYKQRAEAEKAAHMAAYPGYRYAPIGRPRVPAKRKVKRDGNDDTTRSRKIAELIISGLEGQAFQEAAKGLDNGNVEVELTQRTSQPAPKRPKRARASRPRTSVKIKQESPPPSAALGAPPSPLLSDALYTISDTSDNESYESDKIVRQPRLRAARFSPRPTPESEDEDDNDLQLTPTRFHRSPSLSVEPKTEEDDEAFELLPYGDPLRDTSPPPSPENDDEPGFVLHPHMRPGATASLTLGQLFNSDVAPSSPEGLQISCPLPFDMPIATYHEIGDALGLEHPWPGGSSTAFATTTASHPLSTATAHPRDTSRVQRSPSPVAVTTASSWQATPASSDVEELELTYPDDSDVELEEYLKDL